MTSEILDTLNSFNSVRLEEMDKVKLMDRIDTKYVLPANRVPDLIKIMHGRYRILEVSNKRVSSYTTIYLDTPEYIFFNQHVTGKTGRIKVRFRSYNSTGNAFLEIKKKTKKNRTVKWRIENSFSDNTSNGPAVEFLKKHIDFDPEVLMPVLTNSFSRITFAGFDIPERITLDLDLSFTTPQGKSAELPLIAVVELKSEGLASRSPFSRIIKQFSAYPTGFSKYCIGCAMLHEIPLKNILKPTILLINRIENEYNGYISA